MKVGYVDTIELVKDYMTQYGKSVVEDRAIPDFRDGLKPVHRRILWAMHNDLKLTHTSNYSKCAKVTGAVCGAYHPHGTAAVYGALVTLVHERYPLVSGQGNFGNHTQKPAAERYTECRLTPLAMRMFDTASVAEYQANYNGEHVEPVVLPSQLPLLIMNGAEGIGVGVSTCIPSHNLRELVGALICLLKRPKSTEDEVLQHILGPDFALGGAIISDRDEVLHMYKTGKGRIRYRCQYKFESNNGNNLLVITGVPPRFDVGSFLEWCKKREDDGVIEYANDESCEEDGLRVVIGWKNALALNKTVLPALETSVTYQWNVTERAVDDVQFRNVTFIEMLRDWISWRRDVETAFLKQRIEQQHAALSREDAKLKAMTKLKLVAKILTESDALEADLCKALRVTPDQANYLLETNLRSLAKLSREKVEATIAAIQERVEDLQTDLAHIDAYIVRKLKALKPFFDARRTDSAAREVTFDARPGAVWVVGNNDGKLETNYDRLSARWLFDHVVRLSGKTADSYLVASATGTLRLMPADASQKDAGILQTVGFDVPRDYVLAIDSAGLGTLIQSPSVGRKVNLIRGPMRLAAFSSVAETDVIWLWNRDRDRVVVWRDDALRRNCAKRVTNFKQILKNDFVGGYLVLRDGDVVVTSRGHIVEKPQHVLRAKTVFVVGSMNVVFTDRKRSVLDRDGTIQAIRAGDVNKIVRV